ncbi:hypothetical protein SteCoe_6717 [Stentor coeruleus]|uniref:Uncharacterized protein n=1 Tax=Stentor coeruleus TaxID=5963 RepID=A0A1R2CPA2_9CILI|nr:hypothetical protein SteCoe_6717 [Stentor coeruleus]
MDSLSKFLRPDTMKNSNSKPNFYKQNYWNPRFYLSKIPEYDSNKDSHLSFYHAMSNKKKTLNSQKIIKKHSYSKSNFKVSILKQHKYFLETYINLMNSHNIDGYFTKVFLDAISNKDLKDKNQILTNEIRNLLNDTSEIQIALTFVYNRESNILELKNQIISKKITRNEAENYFLQALRNIRDISVILVEKIFKWKEHLQDVSFEPSKTLDAFFVFKGENYMWKMNSDLYFLKSSKLDEFFNFSAKKDPFLIHASQINTKIPSDKFVIHAPKETIDLIRKYEIKMLEDSLRNHIFYIPKQYAYNENKSYSDDDND